MSKTLELVQKQVTRLVALQTEIAKRAAVRDRERAEAEAEFERATAQQQAQLKEFKDQLEAFALDHRDELFGKKKSLEIGDVKIGFRFGQPVIEIGGKSADKAKLLERVDQRIAETAGVERKLYDQCVLIKRDVSLPKLKDLPAEQFDALGVKLVQVEKFYVDLPE